MRTMRNIKNIKGEILESLRKIEEQEHVKILFAVESGSRSWGVESPDSDYDVRFIYVRNKNEYLKLEERSDVIEWQLDEVLDINGWDLDKVLKQFYKGNATLFEWANSSEIYLVTDTWNEIYQVCRSYFSEKAAMRHYCGTAKSTYERFLQSEQVKYKKYIYALRPLLACKYIENYHAVPPVRFDELLNQELETSLLEDIQNMLEIKSRTEEGVLNPSISGIRMFIEKEISYYKKLAEEMLDDRNGDWEKLNAVFLKSI